MESERQAWLKQGVAELDDLVRGEQTVAALCGSTLNFMCYYLQGKVGVIYIHDGKGTYHHIAGYAFQPGPQFAATLRPGEGLCGQAILEKKIVELIDIPKDYIAVSSAMGSASPRHVIIVPFVFNEQVEGVMELGTLGALNDLHKLFLDEAASRIAIIIASSRSRAMLKESIDHAEKIGTELQRQKEELQASNEELEEQTQLLMASESKLKEQQEELQAANEELEEKTEYLERNKKNIEEKNRTWNNCAGIWKKRPRIWPLPASINPSFWPICPMNCERRSTVCCCSPDSWLTTRRKIFWTIRLSRPILFITAAMICSL